MSTNVELVSSETPLQSRTHLHSQCLINISVKTAELLPHVGNTDNQDVIIQKQN